MAEHITAHPPGLFGHIGGVEVALLTITRAGTFGAPVDYVTARRADVPAGTPEVVRSGPCHAGWALRRGHGESLRIEVV